MNSNVMINSNAFEEYINKFDSKLNEIEDTLRALSNDMKEIDGENDTWNSKTGKLVHERFSNVEKNFDSINTELSIYSLFLRDVYEDYKDEEENEIKKLNDNDSYLNVNE